MTTTRAALRKLVYDNLGDHLAFDTTSSGSTTTVVCTGLINEAFGGDDDGFQGFWVIITETGHAAVGEVRRAKRSGGYTASSGTVTVDSVFSGSIGSGVAFELHRYHPTLIHNAINRALRRVYPLLSREILDESLVVDDRLTNSDMETWTGSAFTGWTTVGSPTLTQDTTRVKHGSGSAKIVSGAGTDAQLTQAPEIDLAGVAGTPAEGAFWCWTDTASVARLQLDFGACGGTTNGDYHSGNSSWQFIKVSVTVPDDATQVQLEIQVESGTNTAYFDAGYLKVGPIWIYSMPTTIRKGPHHVSIQRYEDYPEGPYDHISHHPLSGRRIQLRGTGALSTVAVDADTTEVDGPQVEAISYLATQIAAEMLMGTVAGDDQGDLQTILAINHAAYVEMINQPALQSPLIGAERPTQKWHITGEAGVRKLHLNSRPPNVLRNSF